MSAARMLLALLLVLMGALAGSSTALADPPGRVPIDIDDFASAPGEVCSFPVLFEILKENETITFFNDGRVLVTGQLQIRLTNLWDPEKSLELNISGPGWIADGSGAEVALGTGIFILFAGFDTGGPALTLNHGRFEVTRAPDGSITNIQAYGTSKDLCAMLA